MAQKRMLNKSISLSSQVNKLSLKQKLFFTWCIPHLDDFGLIDNDPEVLKATVCPMVKEISPEDIEEFVPKAEQLGLLEIFEDCLLFPGFDNHQSLSEEKKARSKFQRIPRNPQENIGENKNPQKSPVQEKGREDKRREVRIGEEAPLSPQRETSRFFEIMGDQESENYHALVQNMHLSTKIPVESLKSELRKFTGYWLERNKSGTKSKWELEKTFEVKRRLAKWLENSSKWSKSGTASKYQVNI